MKSRQLIQSLVLTLLIAFSTSACLKTRAQLREESDNDSKPQPGRIQEVTPQTSGGYAIDEVKSEITRLSGRIEELERRDKEKSAVDSKGMAEDLKKLEARLAEMEKNQSALEERLSKAPVLSGTSALEAGKQQYEDKEYDAAVESFSAYLKNPKAKNADDAYFLRGESYYRLKQYKKAILDYSKFPEHYQTSKHMPTALYKIGQSFEALGMKDDARGFYQELVDKYPKSSEAKKIKPRLK